jgi:serine/threonine protein phosphatase PrpC
MTLRSAFGSHVGHVREHNEDNYLVRPELDLWAVADGMGGHLAGEVASRVAVDELVKRVAQGESLPNAIGATHHAVLEAVARGEGQPSMGTTIVALQVQDTHYQIAWVGDSRAYLMGQHGLRQLSRDHSFVQLLLDAGAIADSEAAHHPDRNIVTQAIGTSGMPEVKVDTVDGQLYRGDQILLCSDGLSGEVSEQLIHDILAAPGDETAKTEALIAVALKHGGADNVTVVLVSAPEDAPEHLQRGSTVPIDTRLLNRALAGSGPTYMHSVLWAGVAGALLALLLAAGWLIKDKITGQPATPAIQISPVTNDNNPVSRPNKGEKNAEASVQK